MPKLKAVRDASEKYLKELRRTIEKAGGLELYLKNICRTNAVNALFFMTTGNILTQCLHE